MARYSEHNTGKVYKLAKGGVSHHIGTGVSPSAPSWSVIRRPARLFAQVLGTPIC